MERTIPLGLNQNGRGNCSIYFYPVSGVGVAWLSGASRSVLGLSAPPLHPSMFWVASKVPSHETLACWCTRSLSKRTVGFPPEGAQGEFGRRKSFPGCSNWGALDFRRSSDPWLDSATTNESVQAPDIGSSNVLGGSFAPARKAGAIPRKQKQPMKPRHAGVKENTA